MSIKYPRKLIQNLHELERSNPNYSGFEVANAISFSKWGGRPRYENIFFYEPSSKLLNLLENHNLLFKGENKGISRGNTKYKETIFEKENISWTHFISTFSSYYAQNKIPDKNYLNFLVKPGLKILGVNINKMMEKLDSSFERAYLFSLGGDVLQDIVFNTESPWDYRGDILGLDVLQNHLNFSGKLSEFIGEAYEKKELVENENFRKHPLYLQAKKYSQTKRFKLFQKINIMKLYDLVVSGTRLKRDWEGVSV
jgi:hypothetical protein